MHRAQKQGFKDASTELRNSYAHFTTRVPILPPQTLYERLRDCEKHSHDLGVNEIATCYSTTLVKNKFKVFFNFLKTLFWLEYIGNNCKRFFISH